MIEKPVLSNPKNDRCQFCLSNEKGAEFYFYPQFCLTTMRNMLLGCLLYLQTGASAVKLFCSGIEYTLIFTSPVIYILNTNGIHIDLYSFSSTKPLDICKNVVQCYCENKDAWVNLDHMDMEEETKIMHENMAKEELDAIVQEIKNWFGDIPEPERSANV